MDAFFKLLEMLFFTKILGNITLYSILANTMKFLFVFIVLLYVSRIVRMISMDIRRSVKVSEKKPASLRLVGDPSSYDFPVRAEYFLSDNTPIGRADDNGIVLKDRQVSKHQARILQHEGAFFLDDLQATNPTRLNGQVVTSPIQLRSGDRINLAGVEFLFSDGEADHV